MFGLTAEKAAFFEPFAELEYFVRSSAVYFPGCGMLVPYPLQQNLQYLPEHLQKAIRSELEEQKAPILDLSLRDWLRDRFGETLCQLYFFPFHELYTSGLYGSIRPQDDFKSPAVSSDRAGHAAAGYNVRFAYPRLGLDSMFRRLASKCRITYGARVVRIDPATHTVYLAEGTEVRYRKLFSTLPLAITLGLTGLQLGDPRPDPSVSVLVINIGAERGRFCPAHHWVYVPSSRSGFHRVGFYSNVSDDFLPSALRSRGTHVSLYVERCLHAVDRRTVSTQDYFRRVVCELQEWGFIGKVEVLSSSWVETGYTWSWVESQWVEKATSALESTDIVSIGRYGRWKFQGMVDSIFEGVQMGKRIQADGR